LRLDRLLAGSSLHRFRYPRGNSLRRERLVDGRNNLFAFPQTRLGHWYAMTPLVFPAASTGARCLSAYDFHRSPVCNKCRHSAIPDDNGQRAKVVVMAIFTPHDWFGLESRCREFYAVTITGM